MISSSAAAWRTRSGLRAKRGSAISSGLPMLRNSFSHIPWVEALRHTQPPSAAWYTLRGAVLVEREPVRGLGLPVSRQFAICGSSTEKIGSNRLTSTTWPCPVRSATRSAIIALAAPCKPA